MFSVYVVVVGSCLIIFCQQLALLGAEGELAELHEAYTLVCDELQEQRLAMTSAMAQCQVLQQQLAGCSTIGGTNGTKQYFRSPNSKFCF